MSPTLLATPETHLFAHQLAHSRHTAICPLASSDYKSFIIIIFNFPR